MNIIYQKWKFLNSTKRYVSPQISKLYQFGLEVLSSRAVVSLRANARLIPLNWHTAKSKIYRLVSNAKIPLVFISLLQSLHLIGEKDTVAVDFSDFGNGFQILMFAKQTKRGRAIPLYFEILRYPIPENSQNIFIINTVKNFSDILGFKPRLVFDRGFACPHLIKYMAQHKYFFIIRIKKGKSAGDISTRKMFLVKDSQENDHLVWMYCNQLRLIISDPLSDTEPWYLITNDVDSSRKKIIDFYYHRFEIEEFFRDAKRLLNLEHLRCEKELSLTTTLWFTILGIWFFHHLEEGMDENEEKSRVALQLSATRYFFEQLYKEYILQAEGPYLSLNSGG